MEEEVFKIFGLDRSQLIDLYREKANDFFCERLNKTGSSHSITTDECFEIIWKMLQELKKENNKKEDR